MILNQYQQSDAQLIGDIQNNKVGIDTQNIDFITSLLTTNLYSQPIQSFIRETVANGWDSHVEAGTTDKPVIIRLYIKDNHIHIAVRDYGTGLSPERFNEIYLNIGSSSKRLSNNYIGCFGIGRFSALAVSDIVRLTNYYQNNCSKYIMYKDNGKICIDKLFESATEEDNGLEVDVDTGRDDYDTRRKIAEGLKQLTYYNNVYIDDPERIADASDYTYTNFNTRKIHEFKTFKVNSWRNIKNHLLMGNVLYPINQDIISKWFLGLDYVPFAIKCDIGDVDITPNREALIYNQKTIDAINKKCEAALEELREICQSKFKQDFTRIQDYYDFISSGSLNICLYDFGDNTSVSINIPIDKLSWYNLSANVTINNQQIPKNLLDYYKKFLYLTFPTNTVLYEYSNSKFYVKHNNLSIRRFIECYDDNNNLYVTNEPLKPIAKKYFAQNYNYNRYSWRGCYFLDSRYFYTAFRSLLRGFCQTYKTKPTDKTIKFIFEDFKCNYFDIKFYNNTDVPQEFIDLCKTTAKQNKVAAQQKARKCVIYRLVEGRRYGTIGHDTSMTSDQIARYKGTVFFAEKDNAYIEAFYEFFKQLSDFNNSKIIFVEIAQSNLQVLRDLDNTIEFNTVFTEKNNIISKICTYIYLVEKWKINGSSLHFENDDLFKDSKLYDLLYKLMLYNRRLGYSQSDVTKELVESLCKTYLEKNWLNGKIINTIESNIDYIKLNNYFGNNSYKLKDIVFALYEYVTKHNISNKKRLNIIKETLKPILDEYTPNQQLPHFNIG